MRNGILFGAALVVWLFVVVGVGFAIGWGLGAVFKDTPRPPAFTCYALPSGQAPAVEPPMSRLPTQGFQCRSY